MLQPARAMQLRLSEQTASELRRLKHIIFKQTRVPAVPLTADCTLGQRERSADSVKYAIRYVVSTSVRILSSDVSAPHDHSKFNGANARNR